MYENLLPIGSVVLLEEANKRLMITGRLQAKAGDTVVYDYTGCYYPEGIIDSASTFFFNHDAIAQLFFIGFQDQEELAFRSEVLGGLGELYVNEDGQIVERKAEEEPEPEE